VNPRMQSQQQQQQHFELERMRALRASHPLNPSPALINPVHGRRGPFLTVQDLGARHDSSQLEHLIRQRREQQQASALSGSFSGGAHTMDNMRVGMRDPNFLPHHGTLLTSQLQAKFLRSRLGSALSSREDMHTLRRELQFRQQHDTGPIGRFRNLAGPGAYPHSLFNAPNIFNKRSLEALQQQQHQQQNIAFQQLRLENQRRRQKMLQMNQQHHHQQQLESLAQSRVTSANSALLNQALSTSKPLTTVLPTSRPPQAVVADSIADMARSIAFPSPAASAPTVIDIS